MNIKRYAYPALLAGALTLPSVALAATITANLTVNLRINPVCTVSDATLTFTTQTGAPASNVDNDAPITVNCTSGASYQVGFGQGNHDDNGQRRMQNANNDYVDYQIYRETGRSTVLGMNWGTDTIGGTGSGANQTVTVYGRVPPQATAAVGDYTDTVLITVQY